MIQTEPDSIAHMLRKLFKTSLFLKIHIRDQPHG